MDRVAVKRSEVNNMAECDRTWNVGRICKGGLGKDTKKGRRRKRRYGREPKGVWHHM